MVRQNRIPCLLAVFLVVAGFQYSFAQAIPVPTPKTEDKSLAPTPQVPKPVGTRPVVDANTKNPFETIRVSAVDGDLGSSGVAANLWRPFVEDPVKPTKPQREAYKNFLHESHTGIFRLYPLEKSMIITAGKKAEFLPRECAFFSFGRNVHMRAIADIGFSQGIFQAGIAQGSLAYLAPLGDVPIESVTEDLKEIKDIKNLLIPTKSAEIKAAKSKAIARAYANLNETYMLRSTIYGWWDHVIVFRVVEANPDGAVLIIWKRLYKGQTPKIKD